MGDHFRAIYADNAVLYDEMISHEDYQGNILSTLRKIVTLNDMVVVELGAGTGRLTRLLLPSVSSIHAFDASQHMLEAAMPTLQQVNGKWSLCVGDNRQLPSASGIAELAIAGWSLGHSCSWYPKTWRYEIDRAISEMERVLKPGGAMIILETLGTGREDPSPPTATLAEYYHHLECAHGFESTWIRTDYRFASVDDAVRLTQFFFGDELADYIVTEQLVIVPECTGIWWCRKE